MVIKITASQKLKEFSSSVSVKMAFFSIATTKTRSCYSYPKFRRGQFSIASARFSDTRVD